MPTAFYTVEQAAEILNISAQTLRRWIRAGRIETYKFGRGHRIPVEALERFIQESKERPHEPPEASHEHE